MPFQLVTPEPSVQPRASPSRKRACLKATPPPDTSSDPVEVVPSSQSDERELNLPKKAHKNLREISEQVREWQISSSQPNAPPESSDPFDEMDDDDFGLDMDFEYPRSSTGPHNSPTAVSPSRTTRASSQATPRKGSPTRTPTRTSTPQKLAFSVGTERIRYSAGPKSPSPIPVSSASSLTKVATPAKLSSPRKNATPRSSPSKTLSRSSPSKEGLAMDLDVTLLDQDEKTVAIVERIKAEARAKALSMPDEESMVLGSLDDSDSELGSPTNLFSGLANAKRYVFAFFHSCHALRARFSSDKAANRRASLKKTDEDGDSSPLTDIDELDEQMNRRRSSRRASRRSPSPSGSSSATTRTRRPPNKIPTTITNPISAPSRKQANPFAKLLREKARRNRHAEFISGSEDDVNLSDAAERSANGASGSSSQLRRENSDEGDIETMVRKADSRKLFGEEDNGVVGKILKSDRKDRGKGKASAAKLGIPVWEAHPRNGKRVTNGLPPLKTDFQDPLVNVLREFVASGG